MLCWSVFKTLWHDSAIKPLTSPLCCHLRVLTHCIAYIELFFPGHSSWAQTLSAALTENSKLICFKHQNTFSQSVRVASKVTLPTALTVTIVVWYPQWVWSRKITLIMSSALCQTEATEGPIYQANYLTKDTAKLHCQKCHTTPIPKLVGTLC